MIELPKYFWRFQIGIWLLLGFYLFLGGLTHAPFMVALVRNIYYPVIGFVTSLIVVFIFKKYIPLSIPVRWIAITSTCIIMAILCTVAINPITFLQIGMEFNELTSKEFFAGVFNYILIYLVWGFAYLHLDKSILMIEASKDRSSIDDNKMMLEKNGNLIPVPVANITHIKAAGDYIEIFADNACYLNRATLSTFVKEINSSDFIQTHRSNIVNLNHIDALTPLTKGEYQIILKDGNTLKASRTYATFLKESLKNT